MNVAELLSDGEKAELVRLRELRNKALAGVGHSYIEYERVSAQYRTAREQLDIARAGVREIDDRITQKVEAVLEGKEVPMGATLDIDKLEAP